MKHFIEKLRTAKVAKGYQFVYFDVKASFTNVSLEYTIDLVLKRIYDNYEILETLFNVEILVYY